MPYQNQTPYFFPPKLPPSVSSKTHHHLLNLPFPHPHSFPPLLKFAAAFSLLPLGLSLHQLSLALSLSPDPHIASSLVNFYSKSSRISDARNIFDKIPLKTVVPYSAIIAAYSQSGDTTTAFSLYRRMLGEGVRPNSVTLLGLLSGLSQLSQLESVHASSIRYGFGADVVLCNSMVNLYCKCDGLELGRALFDSMACKDIVSWNSMMAGYSRNGEIGETIRFFREMRGKGECPDRQTLGSLLSSSIISPRGGECLHGLVITSGFQSDTQIETCLVSFYLKCGNMESAFLVFDRAIDKDVILWTAMISGLVQKGSADKALVVFQEMMSEGIIPRTTTVASILSACAQLNLLSIGASIHGYIVRRKFEIDIPAFNSLITMYAKCGRLRQCQLVFEAMEDRDLVTWNAIISAYAQNGHLEGAFMIFTRMRSVFQDPDTITAVSLLQACASHGALSHGRLVHGFLTRNEMKHTISVSTSLVDMYSKCGDIKTARRCFDLMPEQDLVSWSAIIEAYGSHGMGEAAIEMYSESLTTGLVPNDVMCMSLLSACTHSGLISQGLAVFRSMKELGVKPRIEHYGCIVDLLCKSGRIKEAVEFMRTMSSKSNAEVLGILLDACRENRLDTLAEMFAEEIVGMKPESAGSYVQLAHGYAALNRWDGVGEAWATMRSMGLRKAPGWSYVELNGIINTFFADSSSHPMYKEMIVLLKILQDQMRETEENRCE